MISKTEKEIEDFVAKWYTDHICKEFSCFNLDFQKELEFCFAGVFSMGSNFGKNQVNLDTIKKYFAFLEANGETKNNSLIETIRKDNR